MTTWECYITLRVEVEDMEDNMTEQQITAQARQLVRDHAHAMDEKEFHVEYEALV